jgi:hypothetical protein
MSLLHGRAAWFFAFAAFFLALAFARRAEAHKPSDSYLTLTVQGARVDGRWDIAIRDLDYAMGLDRDANGSVTWGEAHARKDEISSFALGHLTIRAGEAICPSALRDLQIASHSDGTYVVLLFDASCPAEPKVLDVDYDLFFDFDPQHHGIVRVDDGAGTRTAIFTPEDRRQKFEQQSLAPGTSSLRPSSSAFITSSPASTTCSFSSRCFFRPCSFEEERSGCPPRTFVPRSSTFSRS